MPEIENFPIRDELHFIEYESPYSFTVFDEYGNDVELGALEQLDVVNAIIDKMAGEASYFEVDLKIGK